MTTVMSSARVIFLGGLGRSGTTLLERMLGEMPGVLALGEVVHLWARGVLADEKCGCGEAFSLCEHWRSVGEHAFGRWSCELAERVTELRERVDRTRHIPALARQLWRVGRSGPSFEPRFEACSEPRSEPRFEPRFEPRRARSVPPGRGTRRIGRAAPPWESNPDLAEYADIHNRLYSAASMVSGCPVVVDSSKHASLAFCLAVGGVDLHVVQVVRDPRAVAHSWCRRVARPEDGSLMTRWAPARTSVHWGVEHLALELLARCGVPVTRVRYEDLLDAPRDTVSGLATALGLPRRLDFLDDSEPRLSVRLSVAHTASGNPMRFTVGRLPLTRDDRWRTGLLDRHRRTVTALTWPLMARYGYVEDAA
ncbi:sulfotransferase [Sinosporangium siamense]|uniref:sulfotransferase n=1 Tax=Sinosporangium siamense TaxID=1367973 RepID=UPI00194ED504|nr:sulfotransferase [Sinosporangium siamense]